MTSVETQLGAAIDMLKQIAANTSDKGALSALGITVQGVESMLPYAGVGLKVRASDQTVQALNSLHRGRVLPDKQWQSVMQALRSAHETDKPQHCPLPLRISSLPPMREIQRDIAGPRFQTRSRRLHRGQ